MYMYIFIRSFVLCFSSALAPALHPLHTALLLTPSDLNPDILYLCLEHRTTDGYILTTTTNRVTMTLSDTYTSLGRHQS